MQPIETNWNALAEGWLMDQLTLGVFAIDRDGIVRSWNAWMAMHTGVPASMAVGHPLSEHYPDLEASGVASIYRRVLNSGSVVVRSQRFHRYLLPMPAPYDDSPFEQMQQSARIAPLFDGSQIAGAITVIEDVTERVAGEQALRSSEEHFRSLIENASDIIAILEPDGTISYVSPAIERALGYRPEELIAANSFAYLHPDDVRPVRQMFARVVPRQITTLEFRFRHKDGAWRIIEGTAKFLHDGADRQIVINARDITDRRRIAMALQESEERFRRLADATLEGIAIHHQGVILDANQALAAMFGYQLEEVIGRSVLDLAAPESRQMLIEKVSSGYEHPYEGVGLRKDGSTFPCEVVGRSIPYHGEVMRVASIRDVTERKRAEAALRESEERFRQLAENIDAAFWMRDLEQHRLLYMSPAFDQIWGIERAGFDGDLHSFVDTIHPEDRARFVATLPAMATGHYDEEYRIVRPDGMIRWVRSRAFPVRDQHGAAYRIAGISEDVTARKEVERLKSEFISTVSHELRTPLTSIRGALGLVVGGVTGSLPPPLLAMLEIASKNSERLVRLINDILDIEKIESGRMRLELAPLALKPLAEQAIAANCAYAAEFGVALRLEAEADPWVYADPDRLIQVLTNLLSNAAKFSPRGATVTLRLERGSGMARIAVVDQGQGIPLEFHERIFQKFAQADSSDTRKKGGTGLGLSICKAIVERLGGRISYASEPGQGARFFVDLPEYIAPPPAPEPPPRVLVCEDDAGVAMVLRYMVEQEGFVVDIAPDAAEAKQLLARRAYLALILDLMLPGGQSGIALIRELRATPATRDLPIVVVSAYTDMGRAEHDGAAFGVADWLQKPITQDQLAEALQRAILCMGGRPRILHVEDDGDVRAIVAELLVDIAEVHTARSVAEARRQLARARFDLLLLDVDMAGESGLVLLIEAGRGRGRPLPVVIFSASEVNADTARHVSAALVKSRISNGELRETIIGLIQRAADRHGGRIPA